MQEKVYKFLEKSGTKTTPMVRVMDINSELGELSKEILKKTNYGKTSYSIPDAAVQMEYGDTLFSVIALGVELGLDIETSLGVALKKYEARLEKKGHIGSN